MTRLEPEIGLDVAASEGRDFGTGRRSRGVPHRRWRLTCLPPLWRYAIQDKAAPIGGFLKTAKALGSSD
jgi:hypothetical protein